MKKTFALLSMIILLQVSVMAQPAPEKDADGYTSGQVVLANSTVINGSVKENIRKKGEITVLQEGKKVKYKAGDITSIQVGGSHFVTYNYTFYEVIWKGANITLLRKANEPGGIQYNGGEPIVISSEGNVDDYFIKKNADASFQLLDKKNIKEVLAKDCSSCAAAIDESKFNLETIKKAAEACDKCK